MMKKSVRGGRKQSKGVGWRSEIIRQTRKNKSPTKGGEENQFTRNLGDNRGVKEKTRKRLARGDGIFYWQKRHNGRQVAAGPEEGIYGGKWGRSIR